MEFKVYQKELELQSRGWIPTFHDVTKEVGNIVAMSGVKNGTVCVASHHTTCSVIVQETSHDQAPRFFGTDAPALQVKLLFGVVAGEIGSVGAAHVVGNDFQLRLGVGAGLGRQQEIAVLLVGVALLRRSADVDVAGEDAARPIVQGAVPEHVGDAAGCVVLLQQIDFEILLSPGVGQTVNPAGCVGTGDIALEKDLVVAAAKVDDEYFRG